MSIEAKYVHTNIVARDWRLIAGFYEKVFGCRPVPPERNLKGAWLEELTGIRGAELQGAHLLLPGYGEDGPTLEIFQYNKEELRPETALNRPGLAHLAFAVADVEVAMKEVAGAGGRALGRLTSLEVAGAGSVSVVYMADPEGNIIELQRWSRE